MPNHSRQLAAIMFTDIVGYTALMGRDEDRAFEILRKNRQIHHQCIAGHRGKLLKEMGDGMLVQFDSTIDAVKCAIDIQRKARDAMEEKIRIGIHLGDVTFEGGDVFGDGVNIASRLQSISDPGGIYLSESLQKTIRGKSDLQTKHLGAFKLKNVDYPVSTFAVQGEGLPVPSSSKIQKLKGRTLKDGLLGYPILIIVFILLVASGIWWVKNSVRQTTPTISSLAVLPFENYTGDEGLEYFVAGTHDALIGNIGRVSALRVISRTSSMAFEKVSKSIPEIASELKVDAIVEGSVLCAGEDSVCLQMRVIVPYPEEQQTLDAGVQGSKRTNSQSLQQSYKRDF